LRSGGSSAISSVSAVARRHRTDVEIDGVEHQAVHRVFDGADGRRAHAVHPLALDVR
jgi:hypothetical protein